VSEKEQIDQFANELDKLVDRFRKEYEITYASVIGALVMKTHLLCNESQMRDGEV